jgi:hypothetical protein
LKLIRKIDSRADISANVDLSSTPKVIELSAKSGNGEFIVDLKSMVEDNKGQLKVTAILPAFGLSEKDFQVTYKIIFKNVFEQK